MLFFWLLWGDFCYVVMEAVVPSIMPLKFNELGASGLEIGVILGSSPALVYAILNPIISFKSDRFRSKWGRRIPFILFSMPFLVVCLVVLAFGDKLGGWLHLHLGAIVEHLSPATFAIWFIGVIMVIFTFFNTFVASTFWYLFNDVVPEHMLARFMSWFRVISLLSMSLYNFCVFPYATTHYTEIFLGAALLYLVGFGLMCLNVREGEYPPPPAYVDGQTGAVAAVKTYVKECLGLKHYWFQWISSFLGALSGGMATFMVLFYLALGLNMHQVGVVNGTVSIVVAVMVLGTGWLADRYHPLRVVLVQTFFSVFLIGPVSIGTWLFWRPGPDMAFAVLMVITLCLSAPAQAMAAMGDPPLLMRLFPRSRYGQFCSINGVWRAIAGIIGGVLAGYFLDTVGHWVGGKEEAYRYIPVWSWCFALPNLICTWLLYRSWKKLGGDESYVPPLPGASSGALDKASCVEDKALQEND
jgi:MFS family permease